MKPYYQEDGITIYHGDSREILPILEYGLVLTDPPYGIQQASNYGASWNGTTIYGDEDVSVRDSALALTVGHPAIVFGSWKQPRPQLMHTVLIWDKGPASGMGDLSFPWKNSFEEIYIIGEGFSHDRRDPGVIRGHIQVTWESLGRMHPNQKPSSLFKYLMLRHMARPVLDPFMGSGSMLVAAKELNTSAIGIEIEECYCEIAAKRLSQGVLNLEPSQIGNGENKDIVSAGTCPEFPW